MIRVVHLVLQIALLMAILAPVARAQTGDRIVELEVKMPGAASDDHQQWAEVLADVGADRVRITSADSAKPSVAEAQYGGQIILTVTGVLERGGKLALPGGVFSLQDSGKIRALISKLRVDGAQVTLAQKLAFGLTAEQLVGLSEILAAEVTFETKGQRVGDVVKKIQQTLTIPLNIDSSVGAKLAGSDSVAEELKGLSAGTVLAAIIRPLGLVAVPSRPIGKATELSIVETRSADEHWPVGWPSELSPAKAAPQLFERLNFELNKAPLSDALQAIEQKIHVPMLYDHNSFARDGVELAEIKVTFNKKRQTYFGTVDDLLSQARPRLKLELRVDEAQHPFLWISTAKR